MTLPEDFDPVIGTAVTLAPGLRRIVAPNPSPMTWRGTNTYLLGTKGLAVIDPGPASDAHLQAILDAVKPDQEITHILVTHTHLDHSPLARALAEATRAPILAFGGPLSGRSRVMQDLDEAGEIGGGEGVDLTFEPDQTLADGDSVAGDGWTLETLHTPGHIGNHLSFAWGDEAFVGDHVMSWASSLVSPPDGDLTDFMASCEKLRARDWTRFHAGHGRPIETPTERLDWLMTHRRARESAILTALHRGPARAETLAAQIYTETPPALLGAAIRNVLAHLIDLYGRNVVVPAGHLTADAVFSLR